MAEINDGPPSGSADVPFIEPVPAVANVTPPPSPPPVEPVAPPVFSAPAAVPVSTDPPAPPVTSTPPVASAPPLPPLDQAPPVPAAPLDPYASSYASAPVPPQPYAPQPYAPQPAGPAQGLSITSMVLGIAGLLLSFVSFGFLPAVAAVITGHLAQRRQPWAKPFWLTGIITGYAGVAIGLVTGLFLILVIFFPLLFIGTDSL